MPSWVQCRKTGKFIPKEEYYNREPVDAPVVHGDFNAFVSPIDKKPIESRKQLREHMKKHGVAPSSEFSGDYIEKRAKQRVNEMSGNTPQHREDRRRTINETLQEYGV